MSDNWHLSQAPGSEGPGRSRRAKHWVRAGSGRQLRGPGRAGGVATRAALGATALLVGSLWFTGMPPARTAPASAVVAQSFGAKNASGSASLSAMPSAATTTGDLLVATIRSRNTTVLAPVTTVTDQAGNTWQRAASVTQGGNADGEIWYAANAASLLTSQSVTVTVGGTSATTSAIAFTVVDVTGTAASSLDVTATLSNKTSTATTGSTPTTTQASEIAVGDIGWNGTGITPSAQTAGYSTTTVEQSSVSGSAAAEQAGWKILNAAGAQSYGATLSTTAAWTATIATFKVSTGPPPTPTISGFNPTSGVAGTPVTITGSGYTGTTGATGVQFNGTNATYTVTDDSHISTSVPTGATTGPIKVTAPGGNVTSATSFTVNSPPTPTITSFNPTSGSVGTPVTITGSGYTGTTGASGVQFNGTNATYSVTDDSHISTTVPTGATTGKIKVTAPGGNVTSTATFTVTVASGPPHVLLVVEENTEFGTPASPITGAPYINSLATNYALATQWFAVEHNSPTDYLDLLSGSNQGWPLSANQSSATTLVDELHARSIPWKAYMEHMPSTCTKTTDSTGLYETIHNPFRYFVNYATNSGGWCSTANQNSEGVLPYPGSSGLVSALNGANAPDFVWITPNDCNDMHGDTKSGSICKNSTAAQLITAGDTWLSANIAPVISSTWFKQNGIIIITWDEGTSNLGCCGLSAPGGHIATIVVTSKNNGLGSFSSPGDHYGTLAAIEKAYVVPTLLGGSNNAINGDLTGAFVNTTTPGTISGTVTDSVTTLPVGGATVCISTGGACSGASTATASNGIYTLSSVTPGTYEVTASHAGYAAHSTPNVVVTTGGNTPESFALVPTPGSITGTVTDAITTNPLANATVCIGTDSTCATFTNTTTTASNSAYSFSGLTEGSYQVNVLATNYVSQTVTNVAVTPGGTTQKNFALVPDPGSITGMVKDSVTTTGIASATVCISTGGACTGTSTTTDNTGTYTLPSITEGSYQVTASDGVAYSSLSANVNVAPGTPATKQDFALTAGPGTVSGTVTDSVSTLGISGATVCISTSGACSGASATTASNGTYTLNNVAPGSYEVTASATAYVTQSRPNVVVTTATTAMEDFQLVPNPGSISGTLTDSITTNPLANATVCIGTDATCATFTNTTTTASNGTYSFTGLTEGSYQVNVVATTYVSQSATGVNVAPGAPTTKNFALMPMAGAISGTVTDSVTHAGLFPATVSYSGPGNSSGSTNTTDVSGDYTLTLLPEGSYQVTAAATNHSSQTLAVNVSPNATTSQNFVLASGSPIQHIVVLYQENHSFDNVLGAWCAQNGRCLGLPSSVTLAGGAVVTPTQATDTVPDMGHAVADQVAAMDGGKMDGWAGVGGCGPPAYACVSYYSPTQVPNITALAGAFAVSDHTFSMADSPSFGGHLYAAAASLNGFSGNNPQPHSGVTPGQGWGCDSNLDGTWAPSLGAAWQLVPSCIPDPSLNASTYPFGGAYRATPVGYVPTIMDRLDGGSRSWRLYTSGVSTPGGPGSGGQYSWSICPSFAECLDTSQRMNMVPVTNFESDAMNGTLPNFSIVLPQGSGNLPTSQHNGTSMAAGDNWIGQVATALEQGPEWSSTALFITYDDCGCFYDHLAPGVNPDGTPQGIRSPLVIVSPYAKAGYTDTTPATFASILAFTEQTFGLAALGANDAGAYSFSNSFDFTKAARTGIPMVQQPVTARGPVVQDPNDPT